MQNQNAKFKILSFTLWFCAFSFALLAFSAPAPVFGVGAKSAAEVKSVRAAAAGEPAAIIEQVCSSIYKGNFAGARVLLVGSSKSKSTAITQLTKIISEYESIEQRRRSSREAAYREQLAELEKFRAADTNDVNDVNDVNDIPKMLSVIAMVCEFADERQKKDILSESFVKEIFQRAIDKAAQYESKGKWLDAYASCYSWLQAIDKDNEAYSEYAEKLYEKADIVASFQDSPCETRKERYEKVKKEMFVRAIDALNFNYVSPIDYRQMATKAIRRCELLGEVTGSSGIVRAALSDGEFDTDNSEYDKQLSAWSAALAAILDEVKQSSTGISKDKFIDVFEKVLALNATTLELPRSVLIARFSEAALSSLDPYTVMVWPRHMQEFEKMMTNQFTGIGIEISKRKGLLTVASLLPDTPAYNSGLDAGDVIEAVDGVETKDMSLMCAVRNITGPAGTKVRLTIRRPGEDEPKDITITRAQIIVPPIRGWQRTERGRWLYMIDEPNRIGYVRITNFDPRTAADLEKVLCGLEAEGLRGLILDLRFNTGGLLSSAIEVADKFLEKGLIVVTRPRFWVSSSYARADKKNTHPNYPLVILTNRYSASASEIVAGALADKAHNRAILVGERTTGKGSVQGITSHPGSGAQLKYTMAYYYLPSGQKVESQDAMKKQGRKDWGVRPNIEVKLRTDELREMGDVQRDNDVLVKADHDKQAVPLKKHTVEETLAADPQLAVGLLVIRSKLIQAASSGFERKLAIGL